MYYKFKIEIMDRTSTIYGSQQNFLENAENELIKLAGLLDGEEWDAVRYYLKGLQGDVDDEVIKRIVDFSKKYNEKSLTKEKASY